MAASFRENLKMEKKMVKEFIFGLTVAFIQEDGSKTCCTAMVSINGKMEEVTTENGCIIKCTGKEFMFGKTLGNMKEDT